MSNNIIQQKYNKYIFLTLVFIFSCLCFILFYYQTKGSQNYYSSDLPEHIIFSINNEGYSFLHQIVIFAAEVFSFLNINKVTLYSFIMIFTVISSLILTIFIIRDYFQKKYENINPYFIDFITCSLMLISMIIINPFAHPFYLGVGTPNPWHNPTYIFCKPFSIIVFIYLFKAFDKFKEGNNYTKELIVLSVFSILSMYAKPSFLISFLPTVALVFIYKFLKKEISFKFLFLTGISLLPSIIPLIYIKYVLFNNEQTSTSIVFTFGEIWFESSKNIFLSIILGMIFPLYVFILNIKKLTISYLFVFLNYITAFLITFFISEEGLRENHKNFFWTYLFAMFFMFFVSFEEFFLKKQTNTVFVKIGWILFSLHLLSGVYYFLTLLMGYYFG